MNLSVFSLAKTIATLSVITLSVTLALSPATLHAQDESAVKSDNPLTTYRDKNRVLLIFSPTDSDPFYTEQMSFLKDKAGLEERQLIALPVLADDKAAGKSLPYLQEKYNNGKSAFALVLIGKDSDEAYRSSKPVSASAIYDTIDAMPMRRSEVKEEKKDTEKKKDAADEN